MFKRFEYQFSNAKVRPLKQLEQVRQRTSELNQELRSVGGEIQKVGSQEKEVSEEIRQAGKIASQLQDSSWDDKDSEKLKDREVEDLEKAAENLEVVSSELEEIGQELGEEISGEESFLEKLRELYSGLKSGEYTISGQGAEEFAETLNRTASEIIDTEEEVETARREAERAVEEAEKIIEIGKESDRSTERLLSTQSSVEESRKRAENAAESFRKFRQEMEDGGIDPSRRRFLTAASAATIMGFSGCVGTGIEDTPQVSRDSPDRRNPWGTETLVVSVAHGSQLIEDFDRMLEEALSFWERNDERYLGFRVNFSRRESASNPHISVEVEDEIERCRDMTDAGLVGCYTSSGSSATIKIEAGYERSRVLETLKHELGHALGLKHGDEPKGIMSRNRSERPENFEEKDRIAELFVRGMELHNSGISSYRTGIELYRDERWRDAREKFQEANEKFGRSVQRLEQARELGGRIEERDAVEVIERGEENAARMEEATGHMVASIDAGLNGNRSEREEEFREYKESFREAREVDAPTGRALREALDL